MWLLMVSARHRLHKAPHIVDGVYRFFEVGYSVFDAHGSAAVVYVGGEFEVVENAGHVLEGHADAVAAEAFMLIVVQGRTFRSAMSTLRVSLCA